ARRWNRSIVGMILSPPDGPGRGGDGAEGSTARPGPAWLDSFEPVEPSRSCPADTRRIGRKPRELESRRGTDGVRPCLCLVWVDAASRLLQPRGHRIKRANRRLAGVPALQSNPRAGARDFGIQSRARGRLRLAPRSLLKKNPASLWVHASTGRA